MRHILLALLICLCYGYRDKVPNPDFVQSPEVDNDPAYHQPIEQPSTAKVSGYFKYVVRKALKSSILSEEDRQILIKVDSVDPQIVAEILVRLILKGETSDSTKGFNSCKILDRLLDCQQPMFLYSLFGTYCVFVITLGFFNRKLRFYLFLVHGIVIYMFSVLTKINNDFMEHQSQKISALSKDIPASCKGHTTLMSFFTINKIGDECQKYYHSVIQEPLYQVNYGKCFSYPLWSLVITPVSLIGEEFANVLPKLLEPFPIYLQLFIVGLITAVFIAISLFLVYIISSARHNSSNNNYHQLLEEVREIKANQLPAPMITELSSNLQSLKYDVHALSMEQSRDLVVIEQEGNMAAAQDQRDADIQLRTS